MQDYFISFGTGLSSNDVNSTKNVSIKFLAQNGNDGWNLLIDNKPTKLQMFYCESQEDTWYELIHMEDGLVQSFEFNYGHLGHLVNLYEVAMAIAKKYKYIW